MKLQTKFTLAILAIFTVVAVLMAALTIYEVNTLVIGMAENRVKIYMRAAWEILDGKIGRTRAALDILAQDRPVVDVLAYGGVTERLRPFLESVRRDQKMDVLNVLSPDGKVVLRTRVRRTTAVITWQTTRWCGRSSPPSSLRLAIPSWIRSGWTSRAASSWSGLLRSATSHAGCLPGSLCR